MIVRPTLRRAHAVSAANKNELLPPAGFEYAFYVYAFYSFLAEPLGISVPMLGAVLLTGLAALCVKRLGFKLVAFQPIKLPVAYALSSIAIQVLIHGEPLLSDSIRALINFISTVIIVQTLALRPGFLNRYMIIMLLNGLSVLPFLVVGDATSEVARAQLDTSSTLSNANVLGGVFGFFVAYFVMLGFETKRDAGRLLCWVIAIGSLMVVGLTVSRGALLALAIAIVVFVRHLLRYGLFPVTVVLLLSIFLFSSGLFSRATQSYEARGTEETGRLLVWPLVVERIRENFLTGVGNSNTLTYVHDMDEKIAPHNIFLDIALGSGIVPLFFFTAYWLKAGWGALILERKKAPLARFYLPFLTYFFVNANVGGNIPPTFVVMTLIVTQHWWSTHSRREIWAPLRSHRQVNAIRSQISIQPKSRKAVIRT